VSFDIGARARSLSDLFAQSTGENVRLSFELPDDPLYVVADPHQLDNVLLNLVINARDALGGQGHITIAARAVALPATGDLAAGDYVQVQVTDDGPGIAPDIVNKVFEPFFTTKPIGAGTGLGLSMTYGFARQSGGTARVHSTVGTGTTIELLLPRGLDAPVAESPGEAAAGGGAECILLVDDDASVRAMTLEALVEAGYDAIACADGDAALSALAARRFDLLLTDVGLPGISGRELADRARAQQPGIRVLFITGYAENAGNRQAFLGEGMDMLAKPFNLNTLLRTVRQNLG